MLFNSLEFAVFFPLVAVLYFGLPDRARTPMLLVASCIFYMAFIPVYILILLLTILVDYFAGIYLERVKGAQRKWLLWMSVIATCAILFVFKYYNFFMGNLVGLAHLFGWEPTNPSLGIILPIGLSFHTFQSLSYVVEVYYGRQKAERDFLAYSTYVMFFPQLVAGPIERPQNLIHQFHEHHTFDYARVTSGLKRMGWGFFKKLVVADRLALYVNDVYADPQGFNGLQLTIATIFFAVQIYCDFSGYSDIAIGSARVLGFTLMENFRTPYHSLSVGEFWQRWHISLSTWFRDYLYYPMGGNRVPPLRWCRNVLVTFGVSGLWHGASWTYVVWGVLNGVYLICGRFTSNTREKFWEACGLAPQGWPRSVVRWSTTFALTCVAWVVFRATSMEDAWYILTHLHTGWDLGRAGTEQFLARNLPMALACIALLVLVDRLRQSVSISEWLGRLPIVPRWSAYMVMIFFVVFLGVYKEAQFIYFQF